MKSNPIRVVIFVACMFGSGCDQNQKGPAQKAGENIDNAAQKAADAIEEAGDKIKNSVDTNKK